MILFRAPLLRAMVAHGHEVIAMAADGSLAISAALGALGVEFRALPLQRAGSDPLADLRTIAFLVRELRALRPDVVFAYTIKPAIYGSIAARIAGVPRRVAMITGLGYVFRGTRTRRRRLVGAVAGALYKRALRQCHAIVFQNPDDRAEFARLGLFAPGARVEIVRGSGVDLEHYARVDLPAGPPTFLFVGRLLRDKGIFEFVEAARQVRAVHPATRFQVLGWLDPNPAAVSQADVDGWVREGVIEYLGTTSDVRPYLAAAHALVLPSYHEGTPRSVLEAMSVGRAVVTTDAPGCRETIVDDESGLLVPVKDAAALAAAILRLVDDPALIGRLATAARTRVEELYDARHVAAQMLEIMGLTRSNEQRPTGD
ncbi:MAG: glycosyltransferase family 4 protein [Myxococcota bacterium]|nr:glycosyltransferase family 4 protein [Myxococcota bacterium]